MPRLRFKIRWLMVVVALVALAAGGFREHARLKQLSEWYNRRALFFARRGGHYRLNLALTHADWEAKVSEIRKANEGEWFKTGAGPSPEDCRRLWPYYQSLRLKYEHASRYPWLPVEPDPPEPASGPNDQGLESAKPASRTPSP